MSLEWFGHAYFRLISPAGIRALTDPFSAARGYPIPRTRPHLVTIGKHSTNHSGLEIVGGEPAVLDGLRKDTYDGMRVRKTVGDLTVFNVPTAISGFDDDEKGSAFVFETGGLCIAHLGDIVAPLNASQLRRLGRVHVALVVLSGFVSMGPEAAAEFIRRKLRPNIVIPMHYYDDEETLARFAGRFRRVRRLKTNRLLLRRRALPPPTEVVILRHP